MSSTAFSQVPQPCPIPNWTQFGCPDWTCPSAPVDPMPDSCYPVTWEEMGSFNGSTFTYNSLYLEDMSRWGSNNAFVYQDAWRPTYGMVFSGNPTLVCNFRSDGKKTTRVTFALPGNSVSYPILYRWKKDGNHLAFAGPFTGDPIPGSTNECAGAPCTYPMFQQTTPVPVPFEAIQGVYWVQKNLPSQTPELSTQVQLNTVYDNLNPPYASQNWSSIQGRFNFWVPQTSFSSVPRVMAMWLDVVPEPNVETTIRINVGGANYDLVFAGGDTEKIPPIIPLSLMTSGRKTEIVKGKVTEKVVEVSLKDLSANTDTDGNLVISWIAPVVSTPYMNLYAYVGSPWAWGTVPPASYFAWWEAPPQSSAIVLPKVSWDAVKKQLNDNGFPKTQVHLIYQHMYMKSKNNLTPQGTTFFVRGYSDIVEIPLP